MVTMKDVAALAGVSHGTVSNVLNGAKGVSVDKIKKVEDAIKKLGYNRNALAINLKTTKAQKNIYVILPNISDFANEDILNGILRGADNKGYSISIFTSNELPYREKDILNRARMFNVDGILMMTCQPDNTDLIKGIQRDRLNVVCMQREIAGGSCGFVGIDFKDRIIDSIKVQLDKGLDKIAMLTGPKRYSFDAACVDAYFNALFNANKQICNQYVMVTDGDRESAMRVAVKLLNSSQRPDVIYVSGELLAEGLKKAIELTSMPGIKNPKVIILNSGRWTRVQNENEENIVLPFGEVGETAVQLLIDIIENNSDRKNVKIQINVQKENELPMTITSFEKKNPKKLRVLLHNDHAGKAVDALSNDFKKRTGLDLEIDLLSYKYMLKEIKASKETGKYDVFSIDVPWIKELIAEDCIQELNEYIRDEWKLTDTFQHDIFDEYSMYNGRRHVLPYSFTSQLLFYRKDLFDKLKNKRLYYDWYKEELKVPDTWEEYNKVARFFTRKFNPDSDTLYGTALGGRSFMGATSEFLPRAWAFGGDVFDKDNIVIRSEACINALKNYIACFDYAHPDSSNRWWDDEAIDFSEGHSAMMVQYSDQATMLRDSNISTVVGKTGFDMVPGGVSLFGGWSIGMNKNSKLKDEAFEFIKWTISDDMSMPNAVLGRMIPYKSIRDSYELMAMYPWHRDTFKTFTSAKKRIIPRNIKGECVSEQIFEEIVGTAVHDAILKKCTPENAIDTIHERLMDVFK
jgi:multiple sugar transport system substrate-binding protein